MAGIAAHVTNRDVRAAQAILDAWVASMAGRTDVTVVSGAAALELRGLLAGWAADLREAGYDEGVQVGRQQAAHVVLAALADEGLHDPYVSASEGL